MFCSIDPSIAFMVGVTYGMSLINTSSFCCAFSSSNKALIFDGVNSSSNSSSMRIFNSLSLFLIPDGLPAGFPDSPFSNGISLYFVVYYQRLLRLMFNAAAAFFKAAWYSFCPSFACGMGDGEASRWRTG